jgi:hypothetical protein
MLYGKNLRGYEDVISNKSNCEHLFLYSKFQSNPDSSDSITKLALYNPT